MNQTVIVQPIRHAAAGMELERDLFREAFLAANKSVGKLQDALAARCEALNATELDRGRIVAENKSLRRLLWVYGAWASAATVAAIILGQFAR
jgi:hypothetical protein